MKRSRSSSHSELYEVGECQRVHETSLKTKWTLHSMQDRIKRRQESTKPVTDYKKVESNQQQLRRDRETQMKSGTEKSIGKETADSNHGRNGNETDWGNNIQKEIEEEAQHVIVGNESKDGCKIQDIDPVSEVSNVQQLALLQEDENKRPFKL